MALVDRQPGLALETSFANAGGVCPGVVGPWAAPGVPAKVVRWLFQTHAPLIFRPRLNRAQWRWLIRFVGNCTAERFDLNKERMQRIARYSKTCLTPLRNETGLEYEQGSGGVLPLFRTSEELQGGRRAAEVLRRFDVDHRIVTAAEVKSIEPSLRSSDVVVLAGGLHICRQRLWKAR